LNIQNASVLLVTFQWFWIGCLEVSSAVGVCQIT